MRTVGVYRASDVLCDKWMPIRLEGGFYKTAVVRPAVIYDSECLVVDGKTEQRISVYGDDENAKMEGRRGRGKPKK